MSLSDLSLARSEGPDGDALAQLVATKDELSLKLGSKILTLGYRARGRSRLTIKPLADCADQLFHLGNGGSYRRKPVWIEPVSAGDASADGVAIVPPDARLAVLLNAEVSAGVITTARGVTVAESLGEAGGPDHFGPFTRDSRGTVHRHKPRFSLRRRLHAGPAVLLKQAYDADYGRWLIEGLPRLSLVEDRFDLRRLSFIVSATAGPMQGIYEDSLALFGIRPDQIVTVADETLAVDELIFPAPLAQYPYSFAPRSMEALEQLATRVRANPFGHQRLYVRSGGAICPRNEAAIVAVAESFGFTAVEPESLSLYQQIGLFRQARIVVGSPGPALANALFSTEDLTLFVLAASGGGDDAMTHLMSLKDGRAMVLEGEQGPGGAIAIDSARFARMLAAVIDPSIR